MCSSKEPTIQSFKWKMFLNSMNVIAIDGLRQLRHGPLRRLAPIWLPLGRVYRRLYRRFGRNQLITKRIGGYGPFRINGLFAFSDFENWGAAHNAGFRDCVEACRGRSCVLDIGAHIGLVTLPMSSVIAPDGTVFAFEPAEANRRLLESHVAGNGLVNVVVCPDLVGGDARENVRFFEQAEPSGMNARLPGEGSNYVETRHRQVTLDDFCTRHDISPEVIKIDVEGAEIDVLRGSAKTLARSRPLIFLSVHPTHLTRMGESVEALNRVIEEIGYDCHEINGAAVTRFRLAEYVLTPRSDV